MKAGRFVLSLGLGLALSANSWSDSPVAHHCRPSESLYLTARMQEVSRPPSGDPLYELLPTGKVVSLCRTDAGLVYRQGKPGDVEFEHRTTASSPLYQHQRQLGRIAENYLYFSRGDSHYYIVQSGGMGQGVFLRIFEGGKLVGEFFSGTQERDVHVGETRLEGDFLIDRPPMAEHLL